MPMSYKNDIKMMVPITISDTDTSQCKLVTLLLPQCTLHSRLEWMHYPVEKR